MSSSTRPRRSDTRQRIQDVALEMFAERGYEKTSLREIAERLEVTKAALYYHFRTKEDILVSLFDDLTRPLDAVVDWARDQPRTLESKREALARYSAALRDAAPLFRFLQENQASLRELRTGVDIKQRTMALVDLMEPVDATLTDRMRCTSALFTLHAGMFALRDVDADREEKRLAALEVATELITAAHAGHAEEPRAARRA
ncbi:TetR/AcrR family transcriptional regulator [Streptomyces radicis]|uniref:TetR/AcrR family transcriptional regulator n=1 Tax=Streptomyces radicis TaxID=1750517 RepID=A0A3A9W8Y4_9ACTN|nr:TetR/AcrR family transcriptional regulator [Streptomyces radicis]RKN09761.1 TetR/AcrR family transcriptional regulator [Streptomyces radicis]RKN23398.1 TetR/AcrR family transcriptional regulator [Streptomyces radicis]